MKCSLALYKTLTYLKMQEKLRTVLFFIKSTQLFTIIFNIEIANIIVKEMSARHKSKRI
jgi:hypothetical protein